MGCGWFGVILYKKHLLFLWPGAAILYFSSVNVFMQCSGSTVARGCKKSKEMISFASWKTVPVTIPAERSDLNFFVAGYVGGSIPLTVVKIPACNGNTNHHHHHQ